MMLSERALEVEDDLPNQALSESDMPVNILAAIDSETGR